MGSGSEPSKMKSYLAGAVLLISAGACLGQQQNLDRSLVYFRVSADGEDLGEIRMELFDETTPLTARNFLEIARGKRSQQNPNGFSYKNSIFHRVIPNFMLQGGDFRILTARVDNPSTA